MILICKNCGKEFVPNNSNRHQKFCSRECVKPYPQFQCTCKTCGKEFFGIRRDQRFCSRRCQLKVYTYPKKVYEKNCTQCGKAFTTYGEETRCCSEECRHLRFSHRKGKKKDVKGNNTYVSTKKLSFGRKVRMHRAIVEQSIGRKLSPDEHVHHKNRNKRDNRIENLEVIDKTEHLKIHNKKGRTKNYTNRNVLVDNNKVVPFLSLTEKEQNFVKHNEKSRKYHGKSFKSELNSEDIV
ncbi:HNH endonuclease signature motif containing protein [Tetragenococcus halophilus]|uniref:HNH endonuclease signature motif containing protein n=1 Tax=Tetragenococcus halophilus TaxID=51669 RepID=UPI0030EFD488